MLRNPLQHLQADKNIMIIDEILCLWGPKQCATRHVSTEMPSRFTWIRPRKLPVSYSPQCPRIIEAFPISSYAYNSGQSRALRGLQIGLSHRPSDNDSAPFITLFLAPVPPHANLTPTAMLIALPSPCLGCVIQMALLVAFVKGQR